MQKKTIKELVARVNDVLEVDDYPYRLDLGYFLRLGEECGYEQAWESLKQCRKHLGLD